MAAIIQILQKLPTDQREIFLLREQTGCDFKTAAHITGCSINTAKSRLRYALQRLQSELKSMGFAPEGK